MTTTTTVPTTMRAAVLTAKQRIELREHRTPAPDRDQVLVRVTAVGVCGSDVHFWHDGALGEWVVEEPLVLGHESSGVIVAVGADVPASRIGERVSIEPQRPEPFSPETLAGRYNLDPAMRFYAVPGTDGAFQEYVVIQSHFAWAVPDAVSDEAAALLEPLSVAVAAVKKASLGPESRVLIAGAGPVGLLIAQVARAWGCREVLISDIDADRRAAAARFGATRALEPHEVVPALDVDAFIDASGAGRAIDSGIRAVRPAGRVVLVGMGAPDLPLPVSVIQNRELVVTGVFRYANTWPTAIDLVARGLVDVDALVTERFGLSDTGRALASTRDPGALKVVVRPQS